MEPDMKLVSGAWKLLVGVKDGLVLLFMLLFFGGLYAILNASPNPGDARKGSLLLKFDGPIVEQPETASPQDLLTGSVPSAHEYRLRDVVHVLEKAAHDDDVKTVVLDLEGFGGGGQVALGRVGAALDQVKAAKKPVLVFASVFSDDGYQLAAHGSEVWLDPLGGALFAGPGGSRLYYKGLIDRLGANVHVYRVGKYKSFVEPYTRSEQSPEARAANQALVDTLWSNWKDEVIKARPKAKLDALIADPAAVVAESGGSLSKAALGAGLVDKLGDAIAFGKHVALIAGSDSHDPAGSFNHYGFDDYLAANPPSTHGEKIGIITVAGDIVDGEAASGTAGGDTIAKLIREGLAEKSLKALVVRVDSPGGSVTASEKIRLAVIEAKSKGLPVIVSMGNVAASGGYWVSTAGDKVFAEPSTITGSIGVFGIFPTFEKTLARYGVTVDGVKTTPLSGQPDLIGGTNPTADTVMQAGIEDIYGRFLGLVAASRKMPVEKVNDIAQGRVWDGGAARQLGLVDAFGSLDDAVAEAAKRANIAPDDVNRVYLEPKEEWLTSFIPNMVGARSAPAADIFTRAIRHQQALVATGLADAETMLTGPVIQARCLECSTVPHARTQSSFFTLLKIRLFS
jgi:protease IV